MTEEKVGIVDLKEVVGFGLTLGETIYGVFDGIDAVDAMNLMELIKRAPGAIKDIGLVIPQALDLDDEERAELKAFVEADFDIPSDKIESAIETALSVVIDLTKLLAIFKK